MNKLSIDSFRRRLLSLWDEAEESAATSVPSYTEWSGSTKDLLMALGMVADDKSDGYIFCDSRRPSSVE